MDAASAHRAGATRATRDPCDSAEGMCRGVMFSVGSEDLSLFGAQCRFRSGPDARDEFVLLLPQDFLVEVVLQNFLLFCHGLNRKVLGRLLRLDCCCAHVRMVHVRSGGCPRCQRKRIPLEIARSPSPRFPQWTLDEFVNWSVVWRVFWTGFGLFSRPNFPHLSNQSTPELLLRSCRTVHPSGG